MVTSYYIDENLKEIMADISSEYPYCMHITDLTEAGFPWHWHEELELGYCEAGKIKISTTDADYEVCEKDVFFVNSNAIHMFDALEKNTKTVEVVNLFHAVLLSGHFHSVFEKKYVRPVLENRQLQVVILKYETEAGRKIYDILKRIHDLHSSDDNEFFVRNLLSEAWYILCTVLKEESNVLGSRQPASKDRIRSMISYICEHYKEKITLEEIAASASISSREANRCFQKYIGQSPIDYLTTYRLNNSQKMLLGTEDSITEVAYQNGFADSAYYSKAFKKNFGMSPTEYRAQHRRARKL